VADVEISELEVPPSNGFSNETILFDAKWSEDGVPQGGPLVLRVAPTEFNLFWDNEPAVQLQLLQVLGREPALRVPSVHWTETDPSHLGAPFYLVDRVDGQVPTDNIPYTMQGWVLESTPEEQERLWWSGVEAMARIHNADWRSLGLDFLDRPAYGSTGLDQQLNYYERYLQWVEEEGKAQPVAHAALDWLRANQFADDAERALCWGDSRIGNLIFRDHEVAAVLDWEMASLGDPERDIAWYCYFDRQFTEGLGVDRLPGIPTDEQTIARWEELTGRTVQHFAYYQVLSGFAFSVIMGRLMQLAERFQFLGDDSGMETDNLATQMTARLLNLPVPSDASWGTA